VTIGKDREVDEVRARRNLAGESSDLGWWRGRRSRGWILVGLAA
jgi:hypothetical protein